MWDFFYHIYKLVIVIRANDRYRGCSLTGASNLVTLWRTRFQIFEAGSGIWALDMHTHRMEYARVMSIEHAIGRAAVGLELICALTRTPFLQHLRCECSPFDRCFIKERWCTGLTRVVHMWFPTYVVGNRKCLRNLILIGRLLSSNIGNSMIKILWLKLVDQSWFPTC